MAYKPIDVKERIEHRLKIIQGHLKKVQDMVKNDTYCIDVIHQSQAIQKALKQVDTVLLENHLVCCVVDALKKGKQDTAVKEVMNIFKKSK